MKYSIYQIRLTNLERDVINGMENPHTDHPKFKAYHDAHAENFDKAKELKLLILKMFFT